MLISTSRTINFISILLILLLSITLLISTAEGLDWNRMRQEEKASTIIFAVSEFGESIDPIVILKRGLYTQPPPLYELSERSQEEIDQFIANYYQPGQTYRMLFGEQAIGTITIKAPKVTIYLSAKVNGGRDGTLATNSYSLGRKQQSSRRPTRDYEQQMALELAKKAFQQNGVPDSLLGKGIVYNLAAADLDGDSNYELIGSFKTKMETRGSPTHNLFIIIKQQDTGYKTELEWYHSPSQKDSEFDDVWHSREFLDLLDLDGDGRAEVITKDQYYEGKGYTIYKKQGNKWGIIYSNFAGEA